MPFLRLLARKESYRRKVVPDESIAGMEKFWKFFGEDGGAKRLWNSARIGIPLWIAGALFAGYWFFCVPTPGKAVAALAVVAGIMSVREIKNLGKISWVVLLVCLLSIEFRAIDKDHADNVKAQKEFYDTQKAGFAGISTQAQTNFAATATSLQAAIKALDSTLKSSQHVAYLAQKGVTTSAQIEKQEEQAKERADQDLCHEIDRVMENAKPKVIGFYSFPRRLRQAQYPIKDDEQMKEVQKEADDYLHQGLQPELQALVPKVRARLNIPEDARHNYLRNVLEDSNFSADAINGALKELRDMRQQICPVPKQP